jgi:PilZ domain-containing protein
MKATDRFLVEGAECLVDGERLPVANLSVGGLFAVTDRPPIAGQVMSLDLALPEHSPPLHIRGQVTWVNENGQRIPHMPAGFGVKITQISFVDKLTLLGFLRRSHSRMRGNGEVEV